ncbi:GntR family transcriptional regulator [Fodinicurvata sp. EGI_FJ10296]|uniref:GntR family transcriptional regulator n=1 Tax=Fodinicurvata sp. EGI_FJ10296 TaxID=3231908 RepID=UPI003455D5A7
MTERDDVDADLPGGGSDRPRSAKGMAGSQSVPAATPDPLRSRYGGQAGRSKTEAVYNALRRSIMEGDVAPESRLIIADIAGRLGVSSIPVREALTKLQADGLVVIEPYVGARVTPLAADAIDEIFHHLESLETYTTLAACRKATPEHLEAIKAQLLAMDRLVDDPALWSVRNAEMHHLICDIADTPVAKALLGQVLDHWYRLSQHYMQDVFAERVRKAQDDHWRLFGAMSRGACDDVAAIVREHNREARQDYLSRTGQGAPWSR